MKLKKEKKPFGAPANIPISKNPAVAYQQGFQRGLEDKKSNETICGFEFMQSLLMLVMYNVNVDMKYLSMCRLSDFYEACQAELTRIKDDVIEPDRGITNEDKILMLEALTERVADKFREALERREKREEKKFLRGKKADEQ